MRSTMLFLLLFVAGCASAPPPAPSHSATRTFIELVKIEPDRGTTVDADTVLVATLRYRIENPEAGPTYWIQPWFTGTRPARLSQPLYDLHAEGAVVPLTKSEGEITTRFRLRNVYSNRLLRRPIEVRYLLLRGRGAGLADFILAQTDTATFAN